MSTSEFTIYTASAGAGKTYNLVYRVLCLCLAAAGSSAFRAILAITFTNKAAAEMKDRIVRTLQEFSAESGQGESALFQRFCEELNLSAEELKTKSEEVLRAILHQYSAFSISTIDKFTNRLIRTFAQDLKVSGNYKIELDAELILSEAVDTMLSDLEEDSALAEVLIQFLNAQLEEGKSPRAEYRLLEVGYTLFEERAIVPLSVLKNVNSSDFLEVRQKLYHRNEKWDQEAAQLAKSTLELIDDNNIEHSLFSRGSLPKYLASIFSNPRLELPSPTVQKQMVGESDFYPKNKARGASNYIDPIAGELMERCQALLHFIIDHSAIYELSGLILRNIFSLAVVSRIEKYLEQIKNESNRLPIGEFNQLISKHLRDQPAAFLYERIGDRYRHYFIDEFQDTSRLQ
ncbi:MAG: UvrD-helicase domain-containing protein, partial [Owenweeksia sp.]